jgi:uncharacterized protein (TIGR00730 family)
MNSIKRLCVYCGSFDAMHRDAAQKLGTALAAAGIELVYGGGRIGLMGVVADAVLAGGGRVTGIIPAHLHDKEVGHGGVSQLIVVGSMHERKRSMFEMSDAFAVLPGGLGTLDEAFEMITWKQLRLHDKPIIIVNVGGYWDKLLELIDHVIESGFARPAIRRLFRVIDRIEDVVPALLESHVPEVEAKPDLV